MLCCRYYQGHRSTISVFTGEHECSRHVSLTCLDPNDQGCRDTISLQAIEYYSRLPDGVTVDRIFILDPMVATGGTAIAALKMMKEWGLEMDKVSFLGIIASQSAVDSITKAFPQVDVSPGHERSTC